MSAPSSRASSTLLANTAKRFGDVELDSAGNFTPELESAFARLDRMMEREGYDPTTGEGMRKANRDSGGYGRIGSTAPDVSRKKAKKRKNKVSGVKTSFFPADTFKDVELAKAYSTENISSSPINTRSMRKKTKSVTQHHHRHQQQQQNHEPPQQPPQQQPEHNLAPLQHTKSASARLGTPLALTDMTDSALIAVEKGKFSRAASTNTRRPVTPQTTHHNLTASEMELKKVLLPYLDKLDYIDVELSRRRIGEETMGSGLAETHSLNTEINSETLNSEGPPSHRSASSYRSSSVTSTPRSRPEIQDDDMFFRPPTPQSRDSKRSKRSHGGGGKYPATISPIQHPRTNTSTSTNTNTNTNTNNIGTSTAHGPSVTLANSTKKIDHDAPPPHSMCARYPRVTLLAELQVPSHGTSVTLSRTCPNHCYSKTLVWLLKIIEEVYDAAWAQEIASASRPGGVHVPSKERERKAALQKTFLTVEGENIQNQVILPGKGLAEESVVFGITMPTFLVSFLSRRLGTRTLVQQTLMDLLACTERHRNVQEVDLFSLFLRELYDEDCFQFFLYCRNRIACRLGLSLADLKHRVHPDSVSRLCLPEGAVLTEKHKTITDGTVDVFVSYNQLAWLLKTVVAPDGRSQRLQEYPVQYIRNHLMWMVEAREKNVKMMSGPPHLLADGSIQIHTYKMCNIFLVLKLLVDEFVLTGEAIVKEMKYNDDGERLGMLEMLQTTVADDGKIRAAKGRLDKAVNDVLLHKLEEQQKERVVEQLKRRLLDAQIRRDNDEEMNLEMQVGSAKTGLFLMKNQTVKLQQEVDIKQAEMDSIVNHQNSVWDDIITSEDSGKSRKAKFNEIKRRFPGLSNGVNKAIIRFGMHMVERYRQHQVSLEAAAKFSGDWKLSLEELRVEMAKVVQRAYRKRKKDREAKHQAMGEVNARKAIQRAAAEEEVKRQEAERRRKLAEAERQMARVRDIVRKRRVDEARQKERANIVRQQAAHAEAERRFWTFNRRFVRVVWNNWALQVHIAKQKINKFKITLMKILKNWRSLSEATSERKRSATFLQRIYRGRLEMRKVQKMRQQIEENGLKVKGCLIRMRYRGLVAAYEGWKVYTHRSQRIKKLRDGALGRGKRFTFDRWIRFVEITAEIKHYAAVRIENFARASLAKMWVKRIKKEEWAANYIQTCWRGREGRLRFGAMRQRAWDCEIKATTYRARQIRKRKREVFNCFLAEVKIKKALFLLNKRLLNKVFKVGLRNYAHISKMAKNEEFKRRNKLASIIQRVWRGYLGKERFMAAVRLKKAAIFAQACVRRQLTRTRFAIIQLNFWAATEIQRCHRGHMARRMLHHLKVADFLRAADNNNYDRLLFYFDHWESVIEEADDDGNNALHRAAKCGSTRCVKLCVAEGIDPNQYNAQGKTALHLCIESLRLGRDATVEWLLNHKALVEAPDYDGNTPLLLAARLGRAVCCQLLLENDADFTAQDHLGYSPLQTAVQNDSDGDHEGAIVQLLQYGADANQVGDEGCVPLHDAAAHGEGAVTIINHLLAYDADLSKQDDEGYTPFMYAVNLNLVKVCSLMMEFNCDVDMRDNSGRTPLHIAVAAGNAEVIPVIAEGDVDLEAKDADGDTAMHIAVELDHVSCLKSLLSLGMASSVQNTLGDQPAHTAARLGRVDCMRAMLEYDAHMGRRNWAELTPIGVARMHSQMEIVTILKENFSPEQLGEVGDDDDVDVNAWDDEIMDEIDVWEEAWDDDNQVSYWVSTKTGETRDASHPPDMEVHRIEKARAAGERQMLRRVQVQVGEGNLGTAQYNEHHTREWLEIEQMRLEWRSSIKIEKIWRMKSAKLQKAQLRLERKSANIIQRAGSSFRYRLRDYRFLVKQRAAKRIQNYTRMRQAHHYFKHFLQERLWWYRAEFVLANLGQRFWRGYCGRRIMRRAYEVGRQPHPDDTKNFDYWLARQKEAFPPRRKFQLFDEYTLHGTPQTWEQRRLKGRENVCQDEGGEFIEGSMFRDVRFYVNRVTDKAQWWQPDEWADQDQHDFVLREQIRLTGFTMEEYDAATCMQNLWRTRQARVNFKMMLKAKKLGEEAEGKYLADPEDIISLCNYALYLHVIEQEYERARKLYRYMLEFMAERGPDNAFVLYGCAIFGAVTLEEDWDVIKDWSYRGNVADSERAKKAGVAATCYNLADSGFYKQKALFDQSGESWHNYALCRMLVYHDLAGARDAFIRAVHASPHDKRITTNFNVLIQDPDYYGRPAPWDCFDECMQHERSIAQAEEDEREKLRKEAEEAEELQNSAKKVQRWWLHCVDARKRGAANALQAALERERVLRADVNQELIETESGYDDSMTLYTEVTWEECIDDDGKTFYYNTITGESVWDRPEGAGVTIIDDGTIVSSLEGGALDQNSIVTMPSISGDMWERCEDDDGKLFYYNPRTEESQWETPRLENGEPAGLIEEGENDRLLLEVSDRR